MTKCNAGHELCDQRTPWRNKKGRILSDNYCPEHDRDGTPHFTCGTPVGEECVKGDPIPPPPEGKPPGPPNPPQCPCGYHYRTPQHWLCPKCERHKKGKPETPKVTPPELTPVDDFGNNLADRLSAQTPNDVELLSLGEIHDALVTYDVSLGYIRRVIATIRARDESLEIARTVKEQFQRRAEKAESERDALIEKLEAFIEHLTQYTNIEGEEKRCAACYAKYGYQHDYCPLSNLDATVLARRDQFEEVKTKADKWDALLDGKKVTLWTHPSGASAYIDGGVIKENLEPLKAENERLRIKLANKPCQVCFGESMESLLENPCEACGAGERKEAPDDK